MLLLIVSNNFTECYFHNRDIKLLIFGARGNLKTTLLHNLTNGMLLLFCLLKFYFAAGNTAENLTYTL